MFNINSAVPVVDLEEGKGYYGTEEMLLKQVSVFEMMTVEPSLPEIHTLWNNKDYINLERVFKKIRGGAK